MQLSLTTTLPRHPRAAVMRPLVPLTREAALSQLDRIAALSRQATPRQDGLGAASALLALIGGLVLVGAAAMWRSPVEVPSVAPAAPATVTAAVPTAVAAAPEPALALAPAVMATEALGLVAAPPTDAPAPTAQTSAAEAMSADTPSADELALKARARQLADARRKAAAVAKERMVAEEAQLAQAASLRRDAELLAQQADEQRRQRAAEAAERQPAVVTVAMNTRRSVRETCSGRGLFAEGACHVRECARAEHQGDSVCLRLRDTEEAQRRASIER